MKIEIFEDSDWLRVVTSGTASIEGIIAVSHQVQDHPRWHEALPVILDHRALDMSSLDAATIRALATRHKDASFSGPRAMVVSEGASFGVARIWQSNLAARLQTISAVFVSMEEAEGWLRSFKQP